MGITHHLPSSHLWSPLKPGVPHNQHPGLLLGAGCCLLAALLQLVCRSDSVRTQRRRPPLAVPIFPCIKRYSNCSGPYIERCRPSCSLSILASGCPPRQSETNSVVRRARCSNPSDASLEDVFSKEAENKCHATLLIITMLTVLA